MEQGQLRWLEGARPAQRLDSSRNHGGTSLFAGRCLLADTPDVVAVVGIALWTPGDDLAASATSFVTSTNSSDSNQ